MVDCYNEYNQEDIKSQLLELSSQVDEELAKENTDEKKILKLRCQQLMQGLYLQCQSNENN